MTRHQRNCTAGTVYSYHERQKDAAQSGYGTKAMRLGKDAVKGFDCCCLTLQPCRNPVTTEDGYVYDKEAVLEYVLRRKQEIEKQMKQYKKQLKEDQAKQNKTEKSKHQQKVNTFVATESSIRSNPLNPFKEVSTSRKRKLDETNGTSASSSSASAGSSSSSSPADQPGTSNGDQAGPSTSMTSEGLPSFWIPSLTPMAKATLVKKPDKTVYCPETNKPLRIKDLITINFTLAEDKDDKRPLVAREVRYKCAVTGDILSNSTPVAVLRPSGKVVTMECFNKLIKKDMMDPFSDTKLEESDIIPLQRGGTGFASAGGDKLAARKARPVMMAS